MPADAQTLALAALFPTEWGTQPMSCKSLIYAGDLKPSHAYKLCDARK